MKIFEKFNLLKGKLGPPWLRSIYILLTIIIFFLLIFKACSGAKAKSEVYSLGRSSTWPALDLMGKDAYLLAFLDDLIADVAQSEKVAIDVYTTTGIDLLGALDAGKFDGVLLVITPTPLMEEKYNISEPIFAAGPVLVVPISSKATSLKNLKEKGIGIKNNSPFLFKLNQSQDLTFVPYDNMFTALEDLVKGNLAGVIMEAEIAHAYVNGFYKDKLKVVGKPLTDVSLRVISRWDTRGDYLVEHFNAGLKKLHEEGIYDKLIQKWTLHP